MNIATIFALVCLFFVISSEIIHPDPCNINPITFDCNILQFNNILCKDCPEHGQWGRDVCLKLCKNIFPICIKIN